MMTLSNRYLVIFIICFLHAAVLFSIEKESPFLQKVETTSPQEDNDAECLKALCDLFWEFQMVEFPDFATFVGYPGQNGRWPDYSEEAIAAQCQVLYAFYEALSRIDETQLEKKEALNLQLLKMEVENGIKEFSFNSHFLCVSQLQGIHLDIGQILNLMPRQTLEDYEAILSRLEGIPTWIDQAIHLLEKGLEWGITPPKITLRDIPQQVLGQIFQNPEESPLYLLFQQFPSEISLDDQKRLAARTKELLENQVFGALQKLHDFLVTMYLPYAVESIAMSDLPNGIDWYAFKIQSMTTTTLTAEEIHEIGLKEVERIDQELREVMLEAGYQGPLEGFAELLEHDPQFYYESREALLEGYREILTKVAGQLQTLFGKLPELECQVRPVPDYSEKAQIAAYYMPGSPQNHRPGVFYANTYDLKTRPKWSMGALALHEALPGHHLQISLAQQLENLPEFRKHLRYTAFIEGWGLYAESLGEELGVYLTPYDRFGRLTAEMLRAIRLVVDTGIHVMGWTRQEAIDFFQEHAVMTEHEIVTEVDRYIVKPGQALAYKIGELKIKELRDLARESLGEGFSLREFHDELLSLGTVPLDIAEKHIQQWIKNKAELFE